MDKNHEQYEEEKQLTVYKSTKYTYQDKSKDQFTPRPEANYAKNILQTTSGKKEQHLMDKFIGEREQTDQEGL